MTPTTGKLITAAEFAEMPDPPDGSRQELVQGVIETMPPAKGYHGFCCLRLGGRIGLFVDDNNLGFAMSNDTGFNTEADPDTVRGPDISFWSKERLPEIPELEYINLAPDLAVEVVSPRDHFSKVRRKVQHYLDKGVRLVWVVDPHDRSLTVYRSDKKDRLLTENDTLDGEDVLPGFSCKVGVLFP